MLLQLYVIYNGKYLFAFCSADDNKQIKWSIQLVRPVGPGRSSFFSFWETDILENLNHIVQLFVLRVYIPFTVNVYTTTVVTYIGDLTG